MQSTYSVADLRDSKRAAFLGVSEVLREFMLNPPESELPGTWVLSDGLVEVAFPRSTRAHYPDAGWPTHIVVWGESEVHLFNYRTLDYVTKLKP